MIKIYWGVEINLYWFICWEKNVGVKEKLVKSFIGWVESLVIKVGRSLNCM